MGDLETAVSMSGLFHRCVARSLTLPPIDRAPPAGWAGDDVTLVARLGARAEPPDPPDTADLQAVYWSWFESEQLLKATLNIFIRS